MLCENIVSRPFFISRQLRDLQLLRMICGDISKQSLLTRRQIALLKLVLPGLLWIINSLQSLNHPLISSDLALLLGLSQGNEENLIF